MTTLSLNSNVHFCELNGSYVFLDVRKDRYFTLCREQAEHFSEICREPETNKQSPSAQILSSQLKRAGVLDDGDVRRPIKPYEIANETMEANPGDVTAFSGQAASFFAIAFRAFLQTALIFRLRGFRRTIEKSIEWRERANASEEFSVSEVFGIADHFMQFAPIFFSTQDACLYRSFFLLRCLTLKGIFVSWEFGVQLPPFGAHCWLEFRQHPLNDHPDNIQQYTRIMSV